MYARVKDCFIRGLIGVVLALSVMDRTTLTRQDDGKVRQLNEATADNGQTWRTTFDAIYQRSSSQPTGTITPLDGSPAREIDDTFLAITRCESGRWLVSHLVWSHAPR